MGILLFNPAMQDFMNEHRIWEDQKAWNKNDLKQWRTLLQTKIDVKWKNIPIYSNQEVGVKKKNKQRHTKAARCPDQWDAWGQWWLLAADSTVV